MGFDLERVWVRRGGVYPRIAELAPGVSSIFTAAALNHNSSRRTKIIYFFLPPSNSRPLLLLLLCSRSLFFPSLSRLFSRVHFTRFHGSRYLIGHMGGSANAILPPSSPRLLLRQNRLDRHNLFRPFLPGFSDWRTSVWFQN